MDARCLSSVGLGFGTRIVERPLTSSTKRHINSPPNNAKLDTPFPMWQFGLHNRCFWRTRRSKIKTIAKGGDTPPRHASKHAPRAGKKGTINFAACMRRKAPKNAEKRRKAPKNAENRAPNHAEKVHSSKLKSSQTDPALLARANS